MSGRIFIAGALFYALVAILTFGHSAAEVSSWQSKHCQTRDARAVQGFDCYESGGPRAVFAGSLWPLYWSWELQE